MPGFDGTGPMGMGPMTGRGMGPCGRGYGRPFGFGRGWGRGRGYGLLGSRYGYYGPAWGGREPAASEGLSDLQAEADLLRRELSEIEKRIAELGKRKE
jgi:hypothetical protein